MNNRLTLDRFIKQYDREDAVVLLEGKRKVEENDAEKLIKLGSILACRTQHMIFRSGNAPGADELFCRGVASVDADRLQTVIPYTGHRQEQNLASDIISLGSIDLAEESELIRQTLLNKKNSSLIKDYVRGIINRYTIKATYLIRDTLKVIGTKKIKKASFAIFYDDLENGMSGGTGHTMMICMHNKVPFINQTVWLEWLE